MKQILFSFFFIIFAVVVNAQTDSTLQQYTGKYKFPDGSPVAETTVTIENGVLMATSSMGTTELKKMETDTFEIVAYGGVATFKRNTEGKVNAVQIQVGDLNMEGTKTELREAISCELLAVSMSSKLINTSYYTKIYLSRELLIAERSC